METIINYIVSSKIIFILVLFIVVSIAVTIVLSLKLLNKGWIGKLFTVLIFLVAIAFFPLIISGKYGFVSSISKMCLVNDKICFLDSKRYRATKTYATKHPLYENRLFVIDAENGNLIKSEFIGYDVKWLKCSDNLILMELKNNYIIYDIDKKLLIRTIDIDYLINKFSQLACGIEKLEYIKDFIIIHLKNGGINYYEPFSNTIVNKPDDSFYKYSSYSCYENKISYIENGFVRELYQLKADVAGEKRLRLKSITYNQDEKVLSSDDTFIDGKCNSIFPQEKIILISSYETTDKDKCMITALDFNLKTLWTINYQTLNPKDFYSKNESSFTEAIKYKNNFIFGISGFLYCVDIYTGKILWKKRY